MAKQTVKEQVIVFEGEQKFIAPKVTITDEDTGKTEYVGSDGQPPAQPSAMVMPQAGEPDFCNRLYLYIQSNGNGQATGEQVLAAHQDFQNYCNKPKEETTTTTTKAPLPTYSQETTTTKAPMPTTPASIVSPVNFGMPLGGGGGEEEPVKKKNYWWILLVLGAAYYILTKTRNNGSSSI